MKSNKNLLPTVTIQDLQDYLEKVKPFITDGPSSVNKHFSKLQTWTLFMGTCMNNHDHSHAIHPLVWKNVLKEFPQSLLQGELWKKT
jgi:hypothetical protein